MLQAVPLNVSVQVAQVTLCIPIFFAWVVGGVETSFVFVPASTSISELVERGAVKEALLRGREKRGDLVEKFIVDGAWIGDGGAVPKELRGIAAELFDGEKVLNLSK